MLAFEAGEAQFLLVAERFASRAGRVAMARMCSGVCRSSADVC